jgi:hypothetical protein
MFKSNSCPLDSWGSSVTIEIHDLWAENIGNLLLASASVPSPCCVDLTMLYDGSCVKWWWLLWSISTHALCQVLTCSKQVSTIMIHNACWHFWLAWSSPNSFLVGVGGCCWLSGLGVGFPSCRVGGWTVSDVNAISFFSSFLDFSDFLYFSLFFLFALYCSILFCQLKINYKINLDLSHYFPIFLYVSLLFAIVLYFALMS